MNPALTNFIVSACSIAGLISLIKCVLYIADIKNAAATTSEKLVEFIETANGRIEDLEGRVRAVELEQARWDGKERRRHQVD